jgi:hypothetical protein
VYGVANSTFPVLSDKSFKRIATIGLSTRLHWGNNIYELLTAFSLKKCYTRPMNAIS